MKQASRALYSYSKRGSKDPSIAIEEMTRKEEDAILDSYPQLVHPDFRGWCVKRLRVLGKNEFVKMADRAMKYGNDKQKLFVHLIK